jgi:mitochondrial cardiolipin hydrolase
MQIDSLAAAYQKTFEDKFFSKSERDALRMLLAEANLDQRKRELLRSKVFDIAKNSAGNSDVRFMVEWLEDASRLLDAHGATPTATQSGGNVYFSPGEDCLNAIVGQIQSARIRLDVCVFTISDDRITDALLACHQRRVAVRIVTDNEKLYDQGSDVSRLSKAGIPIRVDRTEYHMHHKYAVVDEKSVLTGSYNWTRSAALYNEENILVTGELNVVRQFSRAFEKMWEAMDTF